MRWSEEVELLREEMRRVLAFMAWHVDWWKQRGRLWEDLPPCDLEGMTAYANRQAALRCAIHDRFKASWEGLGALSG